MLHNDTTIFSRYLNREVTYRTYGTKGKPVLVFPSQNGKRSDYENFGMVEVWRPYIETGMARLVCVDSIDTETWSDANGDPKRRIEKHELWIHHIVYELLPRVRKRLNETFMVTGCSMGGYHAANTFFRWPEYFDTLLALSGIYSSEPFFGNYYDDLIYINSPLAYLSGMRIDHPYAEIYRRRNIIICVGQGPWEDELLESTRQLDAILREKKVPAWVDYWGFDVSHDWVWWRRQLDYFLTKIFLRSSGDA